MKRALCIVVCLLMIISCATAQEGAAVDETVAAPISDERISNVLREYSTTGAQVVFAQDGQVRGAVNHGRIVGGTKEDITDNTVFCLASVTKMVTAIGLMQLVEQGMFELDADISDYLGYYVRNPKFPDTPVTLRQILTHTSGLQETDKYIDARGGDQVLLRDVLEDERAEKDLFHKYEPGTKYNYSNLGGALMGVFIEIGSAMPLDAYMNQYVFEPLGITAHYHRDLFPEGTVFATKNETVPSYTEERSQYLTTHSAGNLWMSALDLTKLILLLSGDGSYEGVRILSPETASAMRQNQSNTGSVKCQVKYGLSVRMLSGKIVSNRDMSGHQGSWQAMRCGAFFDASDHTVCVVLTNKSKIIESELAVYPLLRAAVQAAYRTYVTELTVADQPVSE